MRVVFRRPRKLIHSFQDLLSQARAAQTPLVWRVDPAAGGPPLTLVVLAESHRLEPTLQAIHILQKESNPDLRVERLSGVLVRLEALDRWAHSMSPPS
jgi:hypothetical protein